MKNLEKSRYWQCENDGWGFLLSFICAVFRYVISVCIGEMTRRAVMEEHVEREVSF